MEVSEFFSFFFTSMGGPETMAFVKNYQAANHHLLDNSSTNFHKGIFFSFSGSKFYILKYIFDWIASDKCSWQVKHKKGFFSEFSRSLKKILWTH